MKFREFLNLSETPYSAAMVTKVRPGDNNTPAWYIVRVKDDAISSGPYDTKREAQSDSSRMQWYNSRDYDFCYGVIDDNAPTTDKFDTFKEVKESVVSEAARNVEYWTIHNLAGVPKKFKRIDGDWEKPSAAKAWMASNDMGPVKKSEADKLAKLERDANTAAEKAKLAAIKKQKDDLSAIWGKVQDAVSHAFPDGDPIDYLGRWMDKTGIEMDDINKACNKYSGYKKGYYGYLAGMWDDMAKDALFDAKGEKKAGREFESPFIQYDKDGNPAMVTNPWK